MQVSIVSSPTLGNRLLQRYSRDLQSAVPAKSQSHGRESSPATPRRDKTSERSLCLNPHTGESSAATDYKQQEFRITTRYESQSPCRGNRLLQRRIYIRTSPTTKRSGLNPHAGESSSCKRIDGKVGTQKDHLSSQFPRRGIVSCNQRPAMHDRDGTRSLNPHTGESSPATAANVPAVWNSYGSQSPGEGIVSCNAQRSDDGVYDEPRVSILNVSCDLGNHPKYTARDMSQSPLQGIGPFNNGPRSTSAESSIPCVNPRAGESSPATCSEG